jgi:hypothetical protein
LSPCHDKAVDKHLQQGEPFKILELSKFGLAGPRLFSELNFYYLKDENISCGKKHIQRVCQKCKP